jgi:hypothetical protein
MPVVREVWGFMVDTSADGNLDGAEESFVPPRQSKEPNGCQRTIPSVSVLRTSAASTCSRRMLNHPPLASIDQVDRIVHRLETVKHFSHESEQMESTPLDPA